MHNPPTKLLLASASPRRRELLTKAGAGFTVLPTDADEHCDSRLSATEVVKQLSARKAKASADTIGDIPAELLILAADTVVEAPDHTILGKPTDENDAAKMLRSLSGKRHHVLSGFTLLWKDGIYTAAVNSAVCFRTLTDQEIADYIASGEPMGKAGSYAIQERGGAFVAALEGDFTNVVGLPMPALKEAVFTLFGKQLSDFTPYLCES